MTTENQETPSEKLTFPMKFDRCPVCGSTRRVAETLRDEQAAKGKVPKDCPMVLMQAVTPITEMKTILLGLSSVPVLISQFDVCANPKCGALYCVAVNRQDMATGEIQKMMGIAPRVQQVRVRPADVKSPTA